MVPLYYKWSSTQPEVQQNSGLMTQMLNILTYLVYYETLQKRTQKTPLETFNFLHPRVTLVTTRGQCCVGCGHKTNASNLKQIITDCQRWVYYRFSYCFLKWKKFFFFLSLQGFEKSIPNQFVFINVYNILFKALLNS